MTRRSRILGFGAAALLMVVGCICLAAVAGVTGDVIGFALISAGLIAAISLGFLEIGLSEDRQRERDERRR